MPRVKKTRQNQDKREFPGPILTLSLWQLRQTWRLLLVVGAGVLTAIVLVCAIPLYTQVAQSAALRHTLTTNPQDSYIRVTAFNSPLDKGANLEVEQNITYELRTDLGSTVSQTPATSVVMPPLVSWPHSVIEMVGTD